MGAIKEEGRKIKKIDAALKSMRICHLVGVMDNSEHTAVRILLTSRKRDARRRLMRLVHDQRSKQVTP